MIAEAFRLLYRHNFRLQISLTIIVAIQNLAFREVVGTKIDRYTTQNVLGVC